MMHSVINETNRKDSALTTFDATYSPEDNKLRIYASSRLDSETYNRLRAAGFRWAPKQELFVAPAWSPSREDLCIELAGEIEPEGTTLADRAAAKAERLEALAGKRQQEAGAFSRAAQRISERFAMGQPILIGHHSERKARKDRERADAAQTKAARASEAVNYWLYKASAVQHHANRKNAPKVRARRIKTLLSELRDLQRAINEANAALSIWAKLPEDDAVVKTMFRDYYSNGVPIAPYSVAERFRAGDLSPAEARQQCVEHFERVANGPNRRRWIEHTLNRLSYERELLGDMPQFNGEVTPALVQEFVREHGAEKPKAEKVDGGRVKVSSPVALPAHIADGSSLELCQDEWRDLMRECGFDAAARVADKAAKSAKNAACPLLNVKADVIRVRNQYRPGEHLELQVVEMTKAEYSAIYTDYKGTKVSDCGRYRVRSALHSVNGGRRDIVAVFLTDSKQHERPAATEAAQ